MDARSPHRRNGGSAASQHPAPNRNRCKIVLAGAALTVSTMIFASGLAVAQSSRDIKSLNVPRLQEAQVDLVASVLKAKTGAMVKVGTDLEKLYHQHEAFQRAQGARAPRRAFKPADSTIRLKDDYVVIDAVASQDAAVLLLDLEALGLKGGARFGRAVSGWLPIAVLRDAAALTSLRFARPARALVRAGLATTEGDPAMKADEARDEEDVDGSGFTVGVLSNSFDCLGRAAGDVASGDLPPGIVVLDDTACPLNDEGRAMMQLIGDVAPGASQAFHTASNGQADFANGIIELAEDAGANIVVDDVIYLAEPMFQDGIIAQAVDQVKAMGVSYFSSAGNNGRNSWDSGTDGFADSGVIGVLGGRLHDFDPGPGLDILQTVRIGTGTTIFVLNWDEPAFSVSGVPGSASDVEIYLFFQGLFLGIGGFDSNIGGDAVEVFGVVNSGPPIDLQIGIELLAGPAPGFMKYVVFDPGVDQIGDPPSSFVVEFPTDSGTNYGHSNADGAVVVGAAFWRDTPRFGVFPPEVENFSSAGGTPILFDLAGNRIGSVDREKPNVVGPDGGVTTFFGRRDSIGQRDPNGTHFFGTSASAPHVAAVAALILEVNSGLSPDDVTRILEDTAIDMDDPSTPGFDVGFDFATGFGLVDAEEAVEAADDFGDEDDDDDD